MPIWLVVILIIAAFAGGFWLCSTVSMSTIDEMRDNYTYDIRRLLDENKHLKEYINENDKEHEENG